MSELAPDILEVLNNQAATSMQVQKAIVTAEKTEIPHTVKIGISSNVTIEMLGIYLRRLSKPVQNMQSFYHFLIMLCLVLNRNWRT
jgi:hypothetical protein